MPKTKENPMATKREEITHVLERTGEEDIEIVHLNNEMIIHIRIESKPIPSEPKKGKWAQVAEKLAEENLLGNGRGDRLRKAAREFRDSFRFRDVFADSGKK
jgi:hypothetical protein